MVHLGDEDSSSEDEGEANLRPNDGEEPIEVLEGKSDGVPLERSPPLDLDWSSAIFVDCNVGLPNEAPETVVKYSHDEVMLDGRRRKNRGKRDPFAPYKCSQCDKAYATSSNLARHKQLHRDRSCAHGCGFCGKAYLSKQSLAVHLHTHQLTHACGVCGKLFSRNWLLQGHMRSHTGARPFGCGDCGKMFADRSNLRAHLRSHSPRDPYSGYACFRCHKSFALKGYLDKHMQASPCAESAA